MPRGSPDSHLVTVTLPPDLAVSRCRGLTTKLTCRNLAQRNCGHVQRLIKRLGYSKLWIGAILIRTRLAVLHREDKQNNGANERNQAD